VENTGLRERKKRRTRATITRVALELFARDGFSATTLAAIADGAEVSPRTVSTYFRSKEGIVFGLYDAAIERLRERLAARQPGASVLDVVSEWAREEVPDEVPAHTVDDAELARLRQAAIARDAELWALERRRVRPLADMVTAAFAEELGCPADSLVARLLGEYT